VSPNLTKDWVEPGLRLERPVPRSEPYWRHCATGDMAEDRGLAGLGLDDIAGDVGASPAVWIGVREDAGASLDIGSV
jgi:hypothetical protein